MMKKTALILSMMLLVLPMAAKEERVAGPDGRLVVTVSDAGGKPTYSVTYDGVAFLAPSPLGLKADVGDFTQGLSLTGFAQEAVSDDYSVPTIKVSTVHYRANRGVFSFAKDGKPAIDIIFQVSANDIPSDTRSIRRRTIRRCASCRRRPRGTCSRTGRRPS
jgi:hypothetical protein